MAEVKRSRLLLPCALAAIGLGVAAGALHLYLRFVNNTQGEMYDASGGIDIPYSALLFFLAFAPVFAAALLLSFAAGLLIRAVLRMSANKKPRVD